MPFGFRLSFDVVFGSKETLPTTMTRQNQRESYKSEKIHQLQSVEHIIHERRQGADRILPGHRGVETPDAAMGISLEKVKLLDRESLEILIQWTRRLEREDKHWEQSPPDHASRPEVAVSDLSSSCSTSAELISWPSTSLEPEESQPAIVEDFSEQAVPNAVVARAVEAVDISFEQRLKSKLAENGLAKEVIESKRKAHSGRLQQSVVESIYKWFRRVEKGDASVCEEDETEDQCGWD